MKMRTDREALVLTVEVPLAQTGLESLSGKTNQQSDWGGRVFSAVQFVEQGFRVEIEALSVSTANGPRASDARCGWMLAVVEVFAEGKAPAGHPVQIPCGNAMCSRGLPGLQSVDERGQPAHLLFEAHQTHVSESMLRILALPRANRRQTVLELANLALVLPRLSAAPQPHPAGAETPFPAPARHGAPPCTCARGARSGDAPTRPGCGREGVAPKPASSVRVRQAPPRTREREPRTTSQRWKFPRKGISLIEVTGT